MTQNPLPAPPVAHKNPTETRIFDAVLPDDYAWLRNKEVPDVTQYLEAENAYAEVVMAPLAGLRDELYNEMLSHIKQTDVSVPYRDGAFWYYSRTEEGLQYAINCRKPAASKNQDDGAPGPGSPRTGLRPWGGDPSHLGTGETLEPNASETQDEEVILDGNALAQGHPFFAIGDTDISDDGRWLAYTTDTTGFRQYTLRVKDLATGVTLPDAVERVGSVTWAADNKTIFYTVEDEQQKRQFQLFRAEAGKLSESVLVYQDDDERFNLGVGRTRDGKFIVLESGSHTTTACQGLPADEPTGDFKVIAEREDEHEYSVDHRNGLFYIRTNDKGRNFRLVTTPVSRPGREHWTELIPHRDAIMLEEADLFAGFFIACEREDGLPRLRLWKFSGEGSGGSARGRDHFSGAGL